MQPEDTLLIFARQPEAGAVKTRLSPPLSLEQAAGLYACFLADTLALAAEVPAVLRAIAYHPPEARENFARLAPGFRLMAQSGAGLGERMHRALAAAFADSAQRVVLIGSDAPHLPSDTIAAGFAALRQGADVALGPAEDGGYYLIGLRRPQPELFEMVMSTPQVFAQTVDCAERLGLRVELLPEGFDVDTHTDLERLRGVLAGDPAIPARHTRAWLADYRRA